MSRGKIIKRDKDLTDVSAAEGGVGSKSAASERAAGGDLRPRLFSFLGWRHRGDKVVDDWEAVGGDAMEGLHFGEASAGLHLSLKVEEGSYTPLQAVSH